MAGWDLKEVQVSERIFSEDELWNAVNVVFSNKAKKVSTYKFCFLKSLLDNIFNVDSNLQLPFSMVFERFTEIYWNLSVRFQLSQMIASKRSNQSYAEKFINECVTRYNLSEATSYEALRDDIKSELCKEVGKYCSSCVIGALCEDLGQKFYGFSKKGKFIRFNPSAYAFLCKYTYMISKLNYFEWVKFLEKINQEESAYALASKLDTSSKRGNLSFYRNFLLQEMGLKTCFYCHKPLKNGCEVDHFIPWSFVKDDKSWNFVQSCRSCNNIKRDILPAKGYIEQINLRNRIIQEEPRLLVKVGEEWKGYSDKKIILMHESAEFNGFTTGWLPNYIYE